MAAHAIAGGIIAELQGGEFGHEFLSAGITKGLTPQFQGISGGSFNFGHVDLGEVIIAAVIGGTTSELTGGKFSNGALTAAFANILNNQLSNKEIEERANKNLRIRKTPSLFEKLKRGLGLLREVDHGGELRSVGRDAYDHESFQKGGKVISAATGVCATAGSGPCFAASLITDAVLFVDERPNGHPNVANQDVAPGVAGLFVSLSASKLGLSSNLANAFGGATKLATEYVVEEDGFGREHE